MVTTTRVLAVADEVVDRLYGEGLARFRPDVVVACGDLPFGYLEFIVTMLGKPLLYVPGNHDPDLSEPPPAMRTGWPPGWPTVSVTADPPGPAGCVNIDGRVVDAGGLRFAGIGGSPRYRHGPNQYTQGEMRRRALGLEVRARARRLRDGRGVDVMVTHSPPAGVGDAPDPAHRGFDAFHRLVGKLAPKVLVHGHVHRYGLEAGEHRLGSTSVVNAVGYRVIDLEV